ncbi:MAG: FtsX-like permease family protein [Acidimicrobiales bacterium]|nr:FtsX-like permease family protein [Acidimicrobiales bacterium]
MLSLTFRNLAAQRMRFVSTALAVLLGVAFMAGTLVFNDTVSATFDSVVADANRGVDAMVRAPSPVDLGFGQSGPRLDPAIADEVRGVSGVDQVDVHLFGYAQLVGPDGEPVGDLGQSPVFGVNWVDDTGLNPYELVEGTAPSAGEVVIDRRMARETGFGPGDLVTVLSPSAPREFTVSGVATFVGEDSAAGATSVLFDTATAIELLSPDGGVDAIVVTAQDGLEQTELAERIAARLAGAPGDVEVVTGAQVVEEDQAAFAEMLGPFTVFMLVFAFVAMFVGAFIINNTFSITVAQRTRELAMLRAIGAGRSQVLRSVLAEAVTIGVVASGVGLGAGVAVARGLETLMGVFGLELPDGPLVVRTPSLIVAFAVGVVVTVLSAMLPARRSSRIQPIAALRDVAVDRSSGSVARAVAGTTLLALGILTLLAGLGGSGLPLVGLGAFVILVAAAVLAPVVSRPITGLLGRPLGWVGLSGELATRNAQRSAKRTARTASALMIGVALVSFISVLAASFHASFASALEEDFRGTHVLDSGAFDGRGGISHALADELRAAPGVRSVVATRVTPAVVDGADTQSFVAFDATVGDLFDLGDVSGDLAGLGVDGIAVSADRASDDHLTLGSIVTVGLPTAEVDFVVRAIFEDATWTGPLFVATEAFDRYLPAQLDFRVYTSGDDAVIRRVAAPHRSAEVLDRAEFADSVGAEIDQMLGIIYALLGLAVVISLFGIANTLSLSVHERTRELGLLRAVGMTRRQVRSMIRSEAVVISVFGTVLGVSIGIFFGWATVRALAEQGIGTLSIPSTTLAVVAIGGAIAATLAATLPARRAARLDVLSALAAS